MFLPQLLKIQFVLPTTLPFLLSYYKTQTPEIKGSLNGTLENAFSFERENTTGHQQLLFGKILSLAYGITVLCSDKMP